MRYIYIIIYIIYIYNVDPGLRRGMFFGIFWGWGHFFGGGSGFWLLASGFWLLASGSFGFWLLAGNRLACARDFGSLVHGMHLHS